MKFGVFRTRVAPFTTSRPRAGTARPRASFDSEKLFSHGAAPARRVDHWEALREVWWFSDAHFMFYEFSAHSAWRKLRQKCTK